MKQIKLLIAIASLLLVTNASAKTIDIEMNTNVTQITTKVLNDKIKEMNDDLLEIMESNNNEMMLSLQKQLDDKMSNIVEIRNDTNYIVEDLHKIHADEINRMKEKYKDKKYLCNKKTNNTSI